MKEAFILRECDILPLAKEATIRALVVYETYLALHPEYAEKFENTMAKVRQADELLGSAYDELFKIQMNSVN